MLWEQIREQLVAFEPEIREILPEKVTFELYLERWVSFPGEHKWDKKYSGQRDNSLWQVWKIIYLKVFFLFAVFWTVL